MSRIDQRIALKHRKEKKNKKNNLVMFMCVLAALVICAVCVYGIYDISKKNHEQEVEIAKLEKEEALERQRAEEISGLKDKVNSKAFIEDTAREKFNLAYPDDTVFVPKD
ncbi:MAG TPA: hypothetical protein DCX21_01250 [Eubacterium sp.]|nr:hypothetical protein [Eubacterium sp.]HBZ53553.1 hypothetical protein [Eubacterium sp.]